MKTAKQAREYYLKKARKAIKHAISTSIRRGHCYTTLTFNEESVKLAEGHAYWLSCMGYNCVLNKDELKMTVSWV